MKFLLFRISYIRGEYEGTLTINLKLQDTEHKLNVHKTVRRELGRLYVLYVFMYFQFKSCVQEKKSYSALFCREVTGTLHTQAIFKMYDTARIK